MNFGNLVGQTLDGKYKIERELGKGGMGAVYLSTHIGTERPVALKVIVPQFMERAEFVERFRREARAAGRLRHPNVVDVTDFGFADTPGGRVAYLVMEYLDGCTLGEVLEEEGKLPVSWTIDILEQVCSAVQEAHEQGIIHRDLKPDNIWLEPNQRGGYTVKVLDFGIAKLEENLEEAAAAVSGSPDAKTNYQARATVADFMRDETLADNRISTAVSESATVAQTEESKTLLTEVQTLIQNKENESEDNKNLPLSESDTIKLEDKIGTKLVSALPVTDKSIEKKLTTEKSLEGKKQTNELTRIGAVLGTPLYMSPEQVSGERLTPQSDIYSLGVIAYQMLGGKTPFAGSFTDVMDAHRQSEPPPLETKKVPRKVKKVIMSALSKNPEQRPATAQAFASELRAQSEGIGALLRKSLTIYGEHLPKFLWLPIVIYSPLAVTTILQVLLNFLSVSEMVDKTAVGITLGVLGAISGFLGIFCGYLLFGTATWVVSQHLAVPLRPISLRTAFKVAGSRWRTFAGTGLIVVILTLVGYIFLIIPGLYLSVVWALVAPVIMMEGLRGRAALRRSNQLVKRSAMTTVAAVFLMFLVPVIISGLMALAVNGIIKTFEINENEPAAQQEVKSNVQLETRENQQKTTAEAENQKRENVDVNFGKSGFSVKFSDDQKDMRSRVKETVRDALIQILWLPIQILFSSFSGIIVALLYLKTRQAGGESMQDLLKHFEETDRPRSRWQERARRRLLHSGRPSNRT